MRVQHRRVYHALVDEFARLEVVFERMPNENVRRFDKLEETLLNIGESGIHLVQELGSEIQKGPRIQGFGSGV